jgi:hypothetical protein
MLKKYFAFVFTIIISLSLAVPALAGESAIWETEPNYPLEAANSILPDCTVTGTITDYYYDIDYYKVTISNAGYINIHGILGADGIYSEYLAMALTDSSGGNPAWASASAAAAGISLREYVTPGIYYIVVMQNSDEQNLLINEKYELVRMGTDQITEWFIWDTKYNVPPEKIWNLKFSIPVDGNTVSNEAVYILDDGNNIIPTTVLLQDETTITISPNSPCEPGRYYLYITNSIKSVSGLPLNKAIKMEFNV